LRSIACGYAQGFYFGEAMNQKDVIYLLEMIAKDVKEKGRTSLFGTIRTSKKDSAAVVTGDAQVDSVANREAPQNSYGGVQPPPGAERAAQDQQGAAPPHGQNGRNANGDNLNQHMQKGHGEAPVNGGVPPISSKPQERPLAGDDGANKEQYTDPKRRVQDPAALAAQNKNPQRAMHDAGSKKTPKKQAKKPLLKKGPKNERAATQSMAEALSVAEKAAKGVNENGAGGDTNLKGEIDNKISAMKTEIGGNDVYAQLASGGVYSDIGNGADNGVSGRDQNNGQSRTGDLRKGVGPERGAQSDVPHRDEQKLQTEIVTQQRPVVRDQPVVPDKGLRVNKPPRKPRPQKTLRKDPQS